ncbi:MAG: 2-phospho-L-lactate guanylyltransferase [Chloroflexi bacterium]|nr:2-phospho-L-lactate guanylyltransferase [Chloroflexota bacterium]
MRYRALIPVKSLDEAKSRLAAHLTPDQRAALVLDMLHHILYVLRASKAFEQISVVSADEHVLERAHLWGAQPLREEQQGHNPALHMAALKALDAGASALLTISADLPLLDINDIWDMVEKSRCHDIVLAPSQDNTGTNALLVHPPLAVPYMFGPGSLQRFITEAKERQLRWTLHQSLGLSLDIDTIDDIAIARRYEKECRAMHACFHL